MAKTKEKAKEGVCTCTNTSFDNPECPIHIARNESSEPVDIQSVDFTQVELPKVSLIDIMSLGSLVEEGELEPYVPPTREQNALNHIDFACTLLPEGSIPRQLLVEAARKLQAQIQ